MKSGKLRNLCSVTILFLLLTGCKPLQNRRLIREAGARSLLPETLLDDARTAILTGFDYPLPERNELIPAGSSELGLFVRLRKGNEERGCFTFYRGVDAPEPWLAAAARNAAFTDSRYTPLLPEEGSITLEIAVIGELVPMSDCNDFIPGFHTLLIRLEDKQAIIQAPVAVQRNLNREEFLTMLSVKAGLPPSSWLSPEAQLFRAATIWASAPLVHQ